MRTIREQIEGLERALARGGHRANKVAEIKGEIEALQNRPSPAPKPVATPAPKRVAPKRVAAKKK